MPARKGGRKSTRKSTRKTARETGDSKPKVVAKESASRDAAAAKREPEVAEVPINQPYNPTGIPSAPVEPDPLGTGRQFVPGADKPWNAEARRQAERHTRGEG